MQKHNLCAPKKADETWLEALGDKEQEIEEYGDHSYYKYFDPLLVGRRPNRYYTESNAWQYIWSVQHDVQGLVNLFGGKDAFIKKLDTFFEMSPLITPPKYVGVVGTIGQYVHGNQPSHHVAYLYNYVGQPWKTQQRVRQVCDELYRPGLVGCAEMKTWDHFHRGMYLAQWEFMPLRPDRQLMLLAAHYLAK